MWPARVCFIVLFIHGALQEGDETPHGSAGMYAERQACGVAVKTDIASLAIPRRLEMRP